MHHRHGHQEGTFWGSARDDVVRSPAVAAIPPDPPGGGVRALKRKKNKERDEKVEPPGGGGGGEDDHHRPEKGEVVGEEAELNTADVGVVDMSSSSTSSSPLPFHDNSEIVEESGTNQEEEMGDMMLSSSTTQSPHPVNDSGIVVVDGERTDSTTGGPTPTTTGSSSSNVGRGTSTAAPVVEFDDGTPTTNLEGGTDSRDGESDDPEEELDCNDHSQGSLFLCQDSKQSFDLVTDAGELMPGFHCRDIEEGNIHLCAHQLLLSNGEMTTPQDECPETCSSCSERLVPEREGKLPCPVAGGGEDKFSTAVGFSVAIMQRDSDADAVPEDDDMLIDAVVRSAVNLIEARTGFEVDRRHERNLEGGESHASERQRIVPSRLVRLPSSSEGGSRCGTETVRDENATSGGGGATSLRYDPSKSAFLLLPMTTTGERYILSWKTFILAFEVTRGIALGPTPPGPAPRMGEFEGQGNDEFEEEISQLLECIFNTSIADGSFLDLMRESDSRVKGVAALGDENEATHAILQAHEKEGTIRAQQEADYTAYGPLDTNGADPLRITGIVMFVFTSSLTVLLFRTAGSRRRGRHRKSGEGTESSPSQHGSSILGDEQSVQLFLGASSSVVLEIHSEFGNDDDENRSMVLDIGEDMPEARKGYDFTGIEVDDCCYSRQEMRGKLLTAPGGGLSLLELE